jgi:hypothetical protein
MAMAAHGRMIAWRACVRMRFRVTAPHLRHRDQHANMGSETSDAVCCSLKVHNRNLSIYNRFYFKLIIAYTSCPYR